MSNAVMPFVFDGACIRVFPQGEPSFCVVAKDVCEALGIVWNGAPAINHVPDEWKGVRSVLTPRGAQEMLTLTEEGLYFFLGRSDKPKALPFQKWVYGDVVPSIRKTGQYHAQVPQPPQKISSLYAPLLVLIRFCPSCHANSLPCCK
jgi:prophage antirepressor-like protein